MQPTPETGLRPDHHPPWPIRKTAVIHLSVDGMVIARIRDGEYQSRDDAKTNLATAIAATAGCRRPLLVDVRTAQPLDAKARHPYSGQTLVDRFLALALVVDSAPSGG